MSDQVGNKNVGFLMTLLNYIKNLCFIGVEEKPCVWSFLKLGFIRLQIDN